MALIGTVSSEGLHFRNRIINGGMVIDQRNAGAAVNTSSLEKFIVDRWKFFENGSMDFSGQRSTTAPAGFLNSLLITTAASSSPSSGQRSQLQHLIEGLNVADLGWGAAGAQTITLSFWVRSSLTGQFGGALQNGAQNYSYPFTFTINSANTFEFKTVTVAGPTAGTWNTDNTTGILINFDLGMGSSLLGTAGSWSANDYRGVTGDVKLSENNGATFYITGVQLEVGSVATPFERRPYGTELALCQRYYEKSFNTEVAPSNGADSTNFSTSTGVSTGVGTNRNAQGTSVFFAVKKRASPSVAKFGNSEGNWAWQSPSNSTINWSSNLNPTNIGTGGFMFNQQVADATLIFVIGHWAASSEL
jgi:hypothetical protein